MIDLDNIEFGTVLVNPEGKRFRLSEGKEDEVGAYYVLVSPLGDSNLSCGPRQRLYYGEANGWKVEGK